MVLPEPAAFDNPNSPTRFFHQQRSMFSQPHRIGRAVFVVCLVCLFGLYGSCTWTPQVETVLHESPKGLVSLRTISDNSFRASHPVEIQRTTIERVLRGVYKFRDVRLVENLIGGDPKPVKIFSPSQVAFLTPLLTSALAQATPEEEVFFQCASNQGSFSPITGIVLIHNSTLFLTWKEPLSKPEVLDKQHRRSSGLPNPSMSQDHAVLFAPKEALRIHDVSTQPYVRGLGENTLAIDYQLLAGLPKAAVAGKELEKEFRKTTVKEDSDDREASPHADNGTTEETHLSGPDQETSVDSKPESTSEASGEIRDLKEQMEKLQKELTDQKEELERLKREKP